MKMWRAMRVLVCGSTLMVAGAVAWGQMNVQEMQRSTVAKLDCVPFQEESRSSAAFGSFEESVTLSRADGSVTASQSSNVTATSVAASISLTTRRCGYGESSFYLRFSIPNTRRWNVSWNVSGTPGGTLTVALIQSTSQILLQASSINETIELVPGTYEIYFRGFAYPRESSGANNVSGTLAMTLLPEPSSTQVTYQGELLNGGSAFTGPVDVRFTFFDAPTGGVQIGNPVDSLSVPVQDGRFAVTFLPEGGAFDPISTYAQIAMRTPGGSFVDLPGRTPLTAAAFAIRAASVQFADQATSATTAIIADFATSADTATNAVSATTSTNAAHALQADHALAANSVPFAGITSNPWSRSGSLLSTLQWIGIGKVPSDPLDVLGNIRLNDQNLYFRGGADINHGLGWHGVGKSFATQTPDGPVLFGYSGGALGTKQGGDRMAMWWNSTGQVGINVPNTAGFTFAVGGVPAKPGGGSWATLSDPRAKKNITPMTGTLDRLMQLHGYEYTYRPEFVASGFALPGRQIGLLASEVQQVFPDWVERGSDGYLRVTERSTTALMVEALRDLTAEKERDLAELRQEVARLEALVQARKHRN